MTSGKRLMKAYFNYVYNPVYDLSVAQLNRYQELQKECVRKLKLEDSDRVLCVGLGTGNEVSRMLEINRNIDIVGVDYSDRALRKAQKKALSLGKKIKVLNMDARCLEFPDEEFDKVLCLHVMDFIEENKRVTDEILRVLKDGGQFVITYPSDKEGASLGVNILKDIIRHNIDSGRHRAIAVSKSLVQMLVGTVYLPLFLRSKKKSYSRHELQTMITELTTGDFQIEEDVVYQDFIVCGRK